MDHASRRLTARVGRHLPAGFVGRLALVALVAAVVRVVFVLATDPQIGETDAVLSDARAYYLLGRNIADGVGYVRPFDLLRLDLVHPTAEYPPLLPGLLGASSWLGVRSVDAQQLVLGTTVGTATVVLVGLLGRRVAGETVGLVAAVVAAGSPMLLVADAVLMTESLFALLVTAALLLAYRAAAEPTPLRFAAVGVVLGLGALTRGEGLLLAPLLVVPLALTLRSAPVGRRVALVVVGVGVATAVVVPWTVRNHARLDAFVPVSTNLGTVLDGANCDLTYSGEQIGLWRFVDDPTTEGAPCFQGFDIAAPDFDEAEVVARHRDEGLRYAGDHLDRLSVVVGVRVLRTFALYPDWDDQIDVESLEGRPQGWLWAGTATTWVLLPLAVVGALVLRRSGRRLWPLLSTVVLVVATAALTYGNQRFRIGAEPTLVVLAAVALVAGTRRARRGPSGEGASGEGASGNVARGEDAGGAVGVR